MSAGIAAAQIEKFDLLGFDACLMASLEMLPIAGQFTRMYLASEDLEPGHGWNYAYLDRLRSNKAISAAQLGENLMDGFFDHGQQVPARARRSSASPVPGGDAAYM